MRCLDTYALVEISRGNPKFSKYMDEDFVITDITLAEFYGIILREYDEQTADYWFRKLGPYSKGVSKEILIEAVKYRQKNKKKNLSFFDCVGYIFSVKNKINFLTGDKEFESLPSVEFVK